MHMHLALLPLRFWPREQSTNETTAISDRVGVGAQPEILHLPKPEQYPDNPLRTETPLLHYPITH